MFSAEFLSCYHNIIIMRILPILRTAYFFILRLRTAYDFYLALRSAYFLTKQQILKLPLI